MAEMIFQHSPNRATTSATPGDTDWHQLTIPTVVPAVERVAVTVAICALSAAGGAGSPALVDFDKATTPTVGFPVLGTDVFGVNNNIWYKAGAATDVIYFLFAF